jgi:hypothetical protein
MRDLRSGAGGVPGSSFEESLVNGAGSLVSEVMAS